MRINEQDKNKQFECKIAFLGDVKNKIGEQKIDVVVQEIQSKFDSSHHNLSSNLPIIEHVRKKGISTEVFLSNTA